MGLQTKLEVVTAKSTGIKIFDTTGDYNASTNTGGYGNPNPEKNTIQSILYIESVLGEPYLAAAVLSTDQKTAYLNGTGTAPGSTALKDGVYTLIALTGFTAPSTLTAPNGTTQFAMTNANDVFLQAVGFVIPSVDETKIYWIDRTKTLNSSGGYTTEVLPVLSSATTVLYLFEAKVNALVYDQGEACLLSDIAKTDLGCECSDAGTRKLLQRYAEYLAMLEKFRKVSPDYQGAHKIALKLQSDCTDGCGYCNYDEVTASTDTSVCTGVSIVTSPQDLTVAQGTTQVLGVTVAGTPPFTYQWQKDGLPLPGKTNATLTLSNIQAADEGDYAVVVSNACGTAVSDTTTVALSAGLTPVTITLQPQSVTTVSGADVTFTIAATGSATITYQWRKDGVNLSGETGTTLELSSVDAGDEASYDCVVTNPAGSVISNSVTLTLGSVAKVGWSNNVPALISDVNALQLESTFLPGGTITADFRTNPDPMYLIMAEPSTEPVKTQWYGDVFNNGGISSNPGTTVSLFYWIIIGSYRVYITKYKTYNTTTPIEFRV